MPETGSDSERISSSLQDPKLYGTFRVIAFFRVIPSDLEGVLGEPLRPNNSVRHLEKGLIVNGFSSQVAGPYAFETNWEKAQ